MNTFATAALLAKKGGVGKSTIVLGLASAARARGLRVLVVDLDPQCNTTNVLASTDYRAALAAAERGEARRPEALFDVLAEEEPTAAALARAIYPAAEDWSGVLLAPANARLDLLDRESANAHTAATRLRRALNGLPAVLGHGIDLVIIDTRPAFNLLTVMGAVAANTVLVPVEPERFALEGLRDAWRTLGTLRDAGSLPDLAEALVVISQLDAREAEHRVRVEQIRSRYAPVLLEPDMPDRTVVAQAVSAGLPLHGYPDARAVEPAAVLDKWLDRILENA